MTIAIIGAGASGMFCATSLDKRFEVTIFEAQNAPLKKLLQTGGGRCNFTNTNIDLHQPKEFYPRGAGNLRKLFRRFSVQSAIDFFQELGVRAKVEDEGRVFPISDKASSVANALLKNTRDKIVYNAPIVSIRKVGEKFEITPANDESKLFDVVIFAVGGHWISTLKESIKNLQHSFLPEIPSLYALCLDCATLPDWKTATSIANASICADFNGKKIKVSGAMLLTHFGITGPVALKFSSFAAEELFASNFQANVIINFISAMNAEDVVDCFRMARQSQSKKLIKNYCPFDLSMSFWQYIVDKSGVSDNITYANLSKVDELKIVKIITAFECSIVGKSPSKSEFVTCGGVDCKDVDFSTMQSKFVKNLFFLGECLNIDAITGGYNLHAAWATGFSCSEYLNNNLKIE